MVFSSLVKNPDDVNVRTDLGTTFVRRANPDFDRAVKEFRASLERNPQHEQTLHNLAFALKQKGDAEGLKQTLVRLEQVNPNNPLLKTYRNEGIN